MKRKSIILIFCFCFKLNQSDGQFNKLSNGVTGPIERVYADTIHNEIYVSGIFNAAVNPFMTMTCVGKWNGLSWDTLQNNLQGSVRALGIFNGDVIIGGPMDYYNYSAGQWAGGPLKWNPITGSWELIAPGCQAILQNLYIHGSDLYLLGSFNSICGMAAHKIARYDGTTWYSYPALDTSTGGFAIQAARMYNGELYVGGNFHSHLSNNMKDIARFNGSQWLPVGNGLSGAATFVYCFAEFQGKLIVGGYFKTAWGDPGNSIVAWDGTTWSQLGTGITVHVRSMVVYNNELWVGGGINNAGGIPVSYLAKWDGNQWHSLGITLDNVVMDMAVLGNDLYIGGAFWKLNGDSVNRIIRYNPLTGFQPLDAPQSSFEITPNPAAAYINIQYKQTKGTNTVTVFNSTGHQVEEIILPPNSTNKTIGIEHLPPGIYLLRLQTDAYSRAKKFVKPASHTFGR